MEYIRIESNELYKAFNKFGMIQTDQELIRNDN